MKILITGAAGYMGGMLAEQFSQGPNIEEIICIDKNPCPKALEHNKKIRWITSELSNLDWQDQIGNQSPDVVIHTAWQIAELYGQKKLQHRLNVLASEAVFDFCFKRGVKKLIHFSTISSYGASADNTLKRRFIENDPLREAEHRYGAEKAEVEQYLKKRYGGAEKRTQVFIVRPTTIIGPGEKYHSGKKGMLYMLRNVLPVLPYASKIWCRQYIHEDDLIDIIGLLVFNTISERYEVFNLAPYDYVTAQDIAGIFKKELMYVPPLLIRIIFFILWHVTLGTMPKGGKGSWRMFTYPILVDGRKVTTQFNYQYSYTSHEALTTEEGRYAKSN